MLLERVFAEGGTQMNRAEFPDMLRALRQSLRNLEHQNVVSLSGESIPTSRKPQSPIKPEPEFHVVNERLQGCRLREWSIRKIR